MYMLFCVYVDQIKNCIKFAPPASCALVERKRRDLIRSNMPGVKILSGVAKQSNLFDRNVRFYTSAVSFLFSFNPTVIIFQSGRRENAGTLMAAYTDHKQIVKSFQLFGFWRVQNWQFDRTLAVCEPCIRASSFDRKIDCRRL